MYVDTIYSYNSQTSSNFANLFFNKFVILTFKVRFRVEEMTDYVRKGAKIPESFEEAQGAVDEIQQQYRKVVLFLLISKNTVCRIHH